MCERSCPWQQEWVGGVGWGGRVTVGSEECVEPSALTGIWLSRSTAPRARPCFQSEDMRDEFGGNHLQLYWYRAAAHPVRAWPSPGPAPPAPRGINTIRGRKCGNPQQRAPSLNTNIQRGPRQYQKLSNHPSPPPNPFMSESVKICYFHPNITCSCFQLRDINGGNPRPCDRAGQR